MDVLDLLTYGTVDGVEVGEAGEDFGRGLAEVRAEEFVDVLLHIGSGFQSSSASR
jgi:hypothetical protein